MKTKQDRKKLTKKLDEVYSQYIRLSYADDMGMVKCSTCPKTAHWKEMQNGHYETRGDRPTRWLDKNCHPQCVGCNVFKKGNYPAYSRFMISKYGVEVLDELAELAKSQIKVPTYELQEKIDFYTLKVKEMMK
jgi:hypothetical protein